MSKFSIPLDRLAEKAKLDIATTARKATFDVFRSIVLKSPIRTGRFIGNWNVSVAAPDYSYTATINQSRGESEAAKALSLPIGGVVFISNGLPYANRLEYGYSSQAPAGMIRTSVAEFRQFVDRALA